LLRCQVCAAQSGKFLNKLAHLRIGQAYAAMRGETTDFCWSLPAMDKRRKPYWNFCDAERIKLASGFNSLSRLHLCRVLHPRRLRWYPHRIEYNCASQSNAGWQREFGITDSDLVALD